MMDDIEAQLAQLESQDSSDDMETLPLSKTLKPKQTPVKNNKTPVKNKKPPVKNNKKKLKKPVATSQITPPNEEIKMEEEDSSDDENGFTGFVLVSCPFRFLVFFLTASLGLRNNFAKLKIATY